MVGKHQIGYINERFLEHFKDVEFEAKTLPKFQKLPRYMTDAEIESELKPGFCELGDILAFLDGAPEECKDGYWNLFYTPSFVVHVIWHGARWHVLAWHRDVSAWDADYRVFSPATETSEPKPSTLSPSDSRPKDSLTYELSELTKQVKRVADALGKKGKKAKKKHT